MKKEKTLKLVARLLEKAGGKFSNHGCNDLEEDFWQGVSLEERQQFYKEYHNWNGDPEDYNKDRIGYSGDNSLMYYFSEVLAEAQTETCKKSTLEAIYDVLVTIREGIAHESMVDFYINRGHLVVNARITCTVNRKEYVFTRCYSQAELRDIKDGTILIDLFIDRANSEFKKVYADVNKQQNEVISCQQ